jgi:hypothetical protein
MRLTSSHLLYMYMFIYLFILFVSLFNVHSTWYPKHILVTSKAEVLIRSSTKIHILQVQIFTVYLT